ncbi:MAG: tRNA epoxyqueuosine(34) reductase QueG [Calditrichaeota bacterium]|nr:tRNA epoxyqueuosine(34) reductase QueG [Calditrichota bacterium]RQV98927.1 MAG: tRNA epoxyqueuosine(34) reductase QueG [Calditrichota bacterium]
MKNLAQDTKNRALQLGFDAVGITGADLMDSSSADLNKFIDENRHGSMKWLADTAIQRSNPAAFFPEAQSVVMVALNYFRKKEKMIYSPELGTISIYARGRDYHKILRKKLKNLLEWIAEREPATRGRVFVDSFPIMEKPLAVRAGLGWIAKNSTLIIKGEGSYFFLGGLLLNLPLPPDEPFSAEYCGSCTRCLKACPANALTAPAQLDARKCISYLTIEHHGDIHPDYQQKLGNYIFGCDICQMVCPWNRRFATESGEVAFKNRFSGQKLNLKRLTRLTREEYEKMFAGTAVRRSGYERFRQTLEIALGNLSLRAKN